MGVSLMLGLAAGIPAEFRLFSTEMGLRRLVSISCHKWFHSKFTASWGGVIQHTTILFNILEAYNMAFFLVPGYF